MSKALIFMAINCILGMLMIMGNLDNPTIILFTGIMMICSYMVFQATLFPTTNILSYFMASKTYRAIAIKEYEKEQKKSGSKLE